MTAPTRVSVQLFNAQVNPGVNKVAAITAANATANSGWTDVSAYNGGRIGVIITNATAPGFPLTYTVQISDIADGSNPVDVWTGTGDSVSSSVNTGLIPIPSEAKYVRIIGYGNTTNAVGLKATAFLKG